MSEAMLQVKTLYAMGIITLSCVPPLVSAILDTVADIQYPAEQVSPLDSGLGYPCYYVSEEQWAEKTVDYAGLVIRSYVTLATTIVLAGLGVAALVMRYKGHEGRLVQVLRRDGGIYYMC
ncbi:hypothetical protein FA13DRAFT_1793767 [Coprinellus micaceus]|uniref:Uncharacterized protein n=1 Tax=Coprinellus micaceus TaxID=71717 RepID=A0A4Y7T3N4_COPMI|nr:hypothetical protein FA13DRAFT_1793767 [Coprinellus micaceus]